MDTYSSYNLINMDYIDAPKITFMSNHDNYYYNNMPFGLKNICPTYQRLMGTVILKSIGNNHEVYIIDMIINTY